MPTLPAPDISITLVTEATLISKVVAIPIARHVNVSLYLLSSVGVVLTDMLNNVAHTIITFDCAADAVARSAVLNSVDARYLRFLCVRLSLRPAWLV